ncbi:hypothetical protein Bpla01_06110 [Burkholderia plantarii]|nr:hypothetical protein Bpla01_06110 [Burkholderia plantarii]
MPPRSRATVRAVTIADASAISHREARATEWSGRPSRMSISLAMIDVPSGIVVSNVELTGRSRIVSFTSASPDSLLREPIGKYIDSLDAR